MTPDQIREMAKTKQEALNSPESWSDKIRKQAEDKQQSLSQGVPMTDFPSINYNRESSVGEATGEGLKMTQQGRMGFLESIHGKGNVLTDNDGKVFIYDPKNKEYYPDNASGFGMNDIAENSGSALEALGSYGGTAVGSALGVGMGGIPGAVVGGMAGNAVHQGVSAMLPGDDNMSLSDRALDNGVSGAVSGAGQGLFNSVIGGVKTAIPNWRAKGIEKLYDTPFGQETRDVEQELGTSFPIGSGTGSSTYRMLERGVRNHPFAADVAKPQDTENINKVIEYLQSTLDKTYAGNVGGEQAGTQIRDAFGTAVDDLTKLRSTQAQQDFGVLSQLAKGQKIFSANNLLNAVVEEGKRINELGGMGEKVNESKFRELRNIYQTISDGNGGANYKLTPEAMQGALAYYGRLSKGTGNLAQDLDKAESKRTSKILFDALKQDLDDAADSTYAHESTVGRAIKTARDNYKFNSGKIDEVVKSTIGRVLGSNFDIAPEKLVEKMATMEPSQLKTSYAILKKADSDIPDMFDKYMISRALSKAGIATDKDVNLVDSGVIPLYAAKPGQKGGNFNPERFLKEMNESPYWVVSDPQRRMEMTYAIKGIERLADGQLWAGSQTATINTAYDVMGSIVNPINLAKIVAQKVLVPKWVAGQLFTEEGRRALMTIKTASPDSGSFLNALTYLAQDVAREPDNQNIQPSEDLNAAIKRDKNGR
jgi:hypothetical protein